MGHEAWGTQPGCKEAEEQLQASGNSSGVGSGDPARPAWTNWGGGEGK
jgi:hypothetical protein